MNPSITEQEIDPGKERSMSLKLFARMAELAPDKVPDMILSFANECDFETLEAILKTKISSDQTSSAHRLRLLTAVFPILDLSYEKERAKNLIRGWAELLGIGTDRESLSKLLAGPHTSATVRGLISLGADPNCAVPNSGYYRTPLGEAMDGGCITAVRSMLDDLRLRGEMPLYSFRTDQDSNARPETNDLFTALLSGLRSPKWNAEADVVAYLTDEELPSSWNRALGNAFAEMKGQLGVPAVRESFTPLMRLLSVAKFEEEAQWRITLSGHNYVDMLAFSASLSPALGKILHSAAADGTHVDNWQASVRLHGMQFQVPLLAFGVYNKRVDIVTECLALGASTDFCMPGESDKPDSPFTGPSLLEYAEQTSAPAEIQQLLAARRAQQMVEHVIGKIRVHSDRGIS